MIKYLVLGSGGISGLAFLGALKELHKQEYLDLKNIKSYCGCSIGALISYLLLIGYTLNDLIYLGIKMDFKDFLEINAEDALSFFNNYGFDRGKKMKLILESFTTKRGINKNITLKDLYDITQKHFIITVVCVNTRKVEYLDYKKNPDLSVIDCIRASMAIPFLFQPVILNDKCYIDGGVVKAFPIEIFRKYKNETFGLKSKHMERFYDNKDKNLTETIENFKNFILQVFYCASTNSYRIPSDMKYIETDIHGDGLKINNEKEERIKFINYGIYDTQKYLKNLYNN